jgi:hypothetical protein
MDAGQRSERSRWLLDGCNVGCFPQSEAAAGDRGRLNSDMTYGEVNPNEIRRCPLPPVQETGEDDAEDVGIVFGDQQAVSHQHRERRVRTNLAAPERVRCAG